MGRLNRKGFTLIELLAIIAILALVIGFSAYGIIKAVENSKKEAFELSLSSIKEAARLYSSEAGSSDWKDINDYEDKFFCVTIRELINKGLLKEKEVLNSDYSYGDSTYVAVMKNKVTEVISKEEIIDGSKPAFEGICNGTIKNEVITSYPKLDDYISYTDQINIAFTDAITESDIVDRECFCGKKSGNLNIKGTIDGKNCIFNGLEDNTMYYVNVCMTTERNSKVCSSTKGVSTSEVKKPNINQIDTNIIKITYNNDDIRKDTHGNYFYSSLNGITNDYVYQCALDSNNNFICDSNNMVEMISANTWYKLLYDVSEISIAYSDVNNDVDVKAQTRDESNNLNDAELIANTSINTVYTVNHYQMTTNGSYSTNPSFTENLTGTTGATLTINDLANTYVGFTYSHGTVNGSTVTTTTILADGSRVINLYYSRNKVYIKFNVNGGIITENTQNSSGTLFYTWTTNDGTIFVSSDGSELSSNFFSIYYDNSTGISGLPNYNNSNYMEITKPGYSVVYGNEWIDNNNNVYSQSKVYDASDFCDASEGDCTVELYVNWVSETSVQGIRFYNEKKSPLFCDKFYITSCSTIDSKEVCYYSEKNGIGTNGEVVRSLLATDIVTAKCGITYYVNVSSGLNCRSYPNSSANVVYTFGQCFGIRGGEISLTDNGNLGSGWYYSIDYDCYFAGSDSLGNNKYISTSYPASCNTSTEKTGLCGLCKTNSDCDSNQCIVNGCANSNGSYSCCNYAGDTLKDIAVLCN